VQGRPILGVWGIWSTRQRISSLGGDISHERSAVGTKGPYLPEGSPSVASQGLRKPRNLQEASHENIQEAALSSQIRVCEDKGKVPETKGRKADTVVT
jgi:hypothetical protein